MTKKVYTITLDEAHKIYVANNDFRNTLQSGCFLYIEGSYVLNLPQYVCETGEGKYELTEHARQNLSECALAFDNRTIYKYSGSSTRGDSTGQSKTTKIKETEYKPGSQGVDIPSVILERRKSAKKQFESQLEHTKTCWQRIYEILQTKHANPVTFQDKTLLGAEVFSRAKNNYESVPDVRTIVAISAGYDLGLPLTEELLGLAGHGFIATSKEHDSYRFIIASMFGEDINVKNEMLIQDGFAPLGTKAREKKPENPKP